MSTEENSNESKNFPPRPSAAELAGICAEIASDSKAKDIIRMDMSELSAVAEQFIGMLRKNIILRVFSIM